MEKYLLNKYDFKNYLLKELLDTKQIDLIFWKKTIPVPVDLIYGIFEKRAELLKKYIDHIGAAFVFSHSYRMQGKDWIGAIGTQPTKANISNHIELRTIIRHGLESSKVKIMLKEIADHLLLYSYDINENRLVDALCHEGRKYKRIYIPASIRCIINKYDNELLNHIAQSNGDMFSNVVADELKVYRMGFADAFSGIFNKLIDFIISFSNKGKKGYVSASDTKLVAVKSNLANEPEVVYGTVLDGNVWEPCYVNSGTSCILNETHPYCNYVKQKGMEAEEVLHEFAQYLSEIENEVLRDSDRNTIEILRQELSRKLRIKAEKMVTVKFESNE
jgi:hypothetical protein